MEKQNGYTRFEVSSAYQFTCGACRVFFFYIYFFKILFWVILIVAIGNDYEYGTT
jgi:hypothetical protein